ncbi:MAG: hypothetical protein ACLFPL_00285 [Candidatus Nanoarchaeia archaeon]
MKQSQGEIFGIMIFFVVLTIGFLLYSQFQVVYSQEEQDSILETETQIIVESVVQHLKSTQIQCFENSQLSGVDLLNRCVDNTGLSYSKYNLTCADQGYEIEVCSAFLNTLNSTLLQLFNSTSYGDNEPLHSSKVYTLRIIPSNDVRYTHLNKTISNLNEYNLSLNSSDENYYLRRGYSRISADFQNIPTNQGRFELEMSFYEPRG